MVETLERFATDQVAARQRAAEMLTGDEDAFLLLAEETCGQVERLSLMWRLMKLRLEKGGAPAGRLVAECDLLLSLVDLPENLLGQIVKAWNSRGLPGEIASPIHARVLTAETRLAELARTIREYRGQFATPSRLAVGLEEVEARIKQTDEAGEWAPMRDVIAKMRSKGSK